MKPISKMNYIQRLHLVAVILIAFVIGFFIGAVPVHNLMATGTVEPLFILIMGTLMFGFSFFTVAEIAPGLSA